MPEPLQDYFPPRWVMSQKWAVEYFYEQKVTSLTGDAMSAFPENADKHSEIWIYQVWGRELINGVPHLVIKAEPKTVSRTQESFQIYFDEKTMAFHSFKRKTDSSIGMPRIEYMRNPWGNQSFYLAENHHLILDWPVFEPEKSQKSIGIGSVGFNQRDFVDRTGLNVEFGHPHGDTIQTWQRAKPWWVFSDKIIKLFGRELHIQAKLVDDGSSAPKDDDDDD